MGLLATGNSQNANLWYINTGTLFDMATGKFRAGVNGSWVLDGGLSSCLGITGRAQTYKSGLAGSLIARAMNVHPEAVALIWDTENTVASGAARYDDFVPVDKPVSDRIEFCNAITTNLTEFYDKFKKMVDEKLAHKKDYIVESPFLDPRTGKPVRVWVPTFVMIDSFSKASAAQSSDVFASNDIDSTGMNTLYLKDGMVKTRIMQDLPTRAAKAGIYVIMTAHVGDKIDLDPYSPTPKQMQYMKGSDRMKNVGSGFEFLTTGLVQTLKAEVLQDSNKRCLYPDKDSTARDVNLVTTIAVRGKNNSSGSDVQYVLSQNQGLLNTVTNFNFLRNNKNYGLDVEGNNQKFTPKLLPDVKFTRNTLREVSGGSYRIRRAIELTAQLCFIQNMWSTFRMPDYIRTPIDKFAELMTHSEKCGVDRVLESTGVWSTSKQDRERLTILDVLNILNAKK